MYHTCADFTTITSIVRLDFGSCKLSTGATSSPMIIYEAKLMIKRGLQILPWLQKLHKSLEIEQLPKNAKKSWADLTSEVRFEILIAFSKCYICCTAFVQSALVLPVLKIGFIVWTDQLLVGCVSLVCQCVSGC